MKAANLGDAIAQQWCIDNHADFQGPTPSTPAPQVIAPNPNKTFMGKRFGRLRP